MTVAINTERAGVEISWDPAGSGGSGEGEVPPGFPAHPIHRPDLEPDQGLPGEQPGVEHPIFLPPYIDNSLPGGGGSGIWGPTDPRPSPPIVLPPDVEEGLTDEQIQKIKDFLEGNLPETGGPEYPSPVSSGQAEAVQVFGQGQDGDWSNTAVQPNDGLAFLSYPKGFSGESYIEVRALDGTLVDSGTIQVEA